MVPILKDIILDKDGIIEQRNFYLANTDAFQDPCCVIPDIGGPPNKYFVVKPRNEWAGEFIKWIMQPHLPMDDIKEEEPKMDEMDESEGESEESLSSNH